MFVKDSIESTSCGNQVEFGEIIWIIKNVSVLRLAKGFMFEIQSREMSQLDLQNCASTQNVRLIQVAISQLQFWNNCADLMKKSTSRLNLQRLSVLHRRSAIFRQFIHLDNSFINYMKLRNKCLLNCLLKLDQISQQYLHLVFYPCCGGNTYSLLMKEGHFQEKTVRKMEIWSNKFAMLFVQFMHGNDIINRDIKNEKIVFHEGLQRSTNLLVYLLAALARHSLRNLTLFFARNHQKAAIRRQNGYLECECACNNERILTFQLLFGRVPFQICKVEDLIKVVDYLIYFPKEAALSADKRVDLEVLAERPQVTRVDGKLFDDPFIQV